MLKVILGWLDIPSLPFLIFIVFISLEREGARASACGAGAGVAEGERILRRLHDLSWNQDCDT